jgi:hypothetical protein
LGSSSGSQQPTQTVTSSSDPWSGVQPALHSLYGATQGTYASDIGNQPYSGPTQAPLNPVIREGLNRAYDLASEDAAGGGSVGINAARSLGIDQIHNYGLSPHLQLAGQRYADVYSDATANQNPYLLAQIEANNRRIADKINSSMSGAGRYASGAHTDVLARSLAEAADPVLAQDYAQRQQTRLAALGGAENLYGGGLQRAGQWAQLTPTLDQARFSGSDRLMSLGDFYQNREQNDLIANIKQYEAQQARPWEQLAKYANILQGGGGLGGTKTTTASTPAVPTSQRIFGGALAGAGVGSMFGAPGAGIGALGGGLLGLLG